MFRLCVSLWILALAGPVQADQSPAPAPPPAEALPPSVDPQPMKLANSYGSAEILTFKETTQRGIQLFQQGDYDGAIQAFTAAYVISPKPMFLFNIGQAHRKAGRSKEALSFYQLFLSKVPDTPLRAETQAYIELVRTQQLQATSPGPAQRSAPPVVLVPPVQSIPRHKRGWLWGVVGTTVAAATGVAVGVYLGTRPPAPTLGIVEPTF